MSQAPNSGKSLEGRRVVFVVAPMEYRDEELDVPRAIVENAGATTAVAAPRPGRCQGMLGGTVDASFSTSSLRAADWDAAVVVGGGGSPEHLWEDANLHAFLRELAAEGRPVAGICLSAAVLAKAGLLEGKVATVWPDSKAIAALGDGGARYEKAPVQVDGLVVTAEGPHAAEPFGQKIVEALESVAVAARR